MIRLARGPSRNEPFNCATLSTLHRRTRHDGIVPNARNGSFANLPPTPSPSLVWAQKRAGKTKTAPLPAPFWVPGIGPTQTGAGGSDPLGHGWVYAIR